MSLRSLPPSERAWASLVVLALAATLGLGLVSAHRQELRPAQPGEPPAAASRLLVVLEGVMAPNVTPGEVERFRRWVAHGATREAFAPVEAVVANNCAGCHGPGGQFPRITGFEDLRPLALEPAPSGLLGLVDPRTLHLIAFPAIFLVAAGAYLRRIAWRGRRALLAGCMLAVAFDATQAWLRQGNPTHFWAAWLGLAGLAAAMLGLTAAVLFDLWRGTSR